MKKILQFIFILFFANQAFAADYYWVGGTGNWSDFANHWATTSGGSAFHLQVPTLNDNVFFDANSFTAAGQTVTNDQTIIYCRDMKWNGVTNTPSFAGSSSNELKIYGSLFFSAGMNLTYNGKIYFEATTAGHTITMAGKSFNQYIYFNGLGGSWSFNDAFQSSTWVNLVRGTVSTNNNTVTVGSFYASANNAMTLNLGASLVTVTGSTFAWWVNNTMFTLNAGTSRIRLSAASAPDIRYANNLTFHDVEFSNPTATASIISSNNCTFNSLTFLGHGVINGSHLPANLNLSAGKTYELQNGQTQTVSTVNAIGNCTAFITIRSLTAGAQATLRKTSGSLLVDFVQLKDINATGGAGFTANNAVDLGNNSGWTINVSPSRVLYWIGGTGNWSDPNHWSLSSGGVGPQCPPTFQDNVFFDAGSFTAAGQTVTIDGQAYCRDMSWAGVTNNPTFAGISTNDLRIYGSLTFASGMSRTYQGKTYFEATTLGKTITMAGQTFNQYIYFNGLGGGWTILDAFTSSTWVNLVRGTVNTNSNNVTVGAFYASANNAMTLNLGSSLVTVTGSTFAWWVNNTLFTLNAGTSLIRLTASSAPDIRYANNLTFYNIEFTNPTTIANIISSNNSTFNSVTFFGHGIINGSHTYNTLNLAAGKTYDLQSGQTQTVSTLNANGTCTAYIVIRALTAGTRSTIRKTSGTIDVDFVQLKDQAATGGAVFTATNAVNQGNNIGWIINASAPRNLYWIGGSGNWSDLNHWAFSSGGAGPQCPPTFQDNVFFDANSFSAAGQTVTLDGQAYCNDMDWTGVSNNPTFTGISTNELHIFGSLTFAAAMNRTYLGKTYFESTSAGNTITMAGQTFNQYIYFNGLGGEWTLLDALNSSTWVNLVSGTLNTNGNRMTVGALYASANNPMTLNLGASIVTITGSTFAWWINNTMFVLNAGTSLIRFTASSAPDIRYANNLTFYDVEFTAPNAIANIISSNNNTFHSVIFYGDGAISGNHTFADISFSPGHTYTFAAGSTQTFTNSFKAFGTGGFPIEIESTIAGVQANFVMASGTVCATFLFIRDNNAGGGASWFAENSTNNGNISGWILGPCSLLPIELIQFNGRITGSENQLLWITASEKNSAYFILEKSQDALEWTILGTVDAVGNSSIETDYTLTDPTPYQKTYYRLKMVDFDGSETELPVILLENNNTIRFEDIALFPNPADNDITLSLPAALSNSKVSIKLFDALGQAYCVRELLSKDAANKLNLNTASIPAGLYFLSISYENLQQVEKIVIKH